MWWWTIRVNDEVERVLGLAEAVGEPVTVTFVWEGGEEPERAVLVPAATLALWEHWAPTAYEASSAGDEKQAVAKEPEPAHPAEFGAFTLFRRRAGGRTAVARAGLWSPNSSTPTRHTGSGRRPALSARASWIQNRGRRSRSSSPGRRPSTSSDTPGRRAARLNAGVGSPCRILRHDRGDGMRLRTA